MTDIQTLTTVTEAQAALAGLAESYEWVSVFWDKRDRPKPEISIMVDGDGADPKAWLTVEVYAALVDSGVVGEDTYGGFHARRIHDYCVPPTPERTGPTANEVAEQVVRELIDTYNDLPIVGEFWRGVGEARDYSETDAAEDGWYVLVLPTASDMCLSAKEPTPLGPDTIGRALATSVPYPVRGDEVDLDALAGPAFREALLAAIREKVVLIDETRTKA